MSSNCKPLQSGIINENCDIAVLTISIVAKRRWNVLSARLLVGTRGKQTCN